MLVPYSNVELPQQRPDRYTRRLTAFIDSLIQKLGIQEAEYRGRTEEGLKGLAIAESNLKQFQYTSNIKEDDSLSNSLFYFAILIGFIYLLTRFQKA